MHIVALVDVEAIQPDDPQYQRPADGAPRWMEFHVVQALRALGHSVHVAAIAPPVVETIAALARQRPALVFNMTEAYCGERRYDMHLAAVLELLQLRYTGTGPESLLLCRDKAESKERLRRLGVRAPTFAVVRPGERKLSRERKLPPLRYPVLVKPQLGDGSDGITRSSLALSEAAALGQAAVLHRRFGAPAICEEYIEGREFKVALVGNRRPLVLPPREVRFGPRGPRFLTARAKNDRAYRDRSGITIPRAVLTPGELAAVSRCAVDSYRALGLRDYGKIDLRLDDRGQAWFIEANPNPDLSPTGMGTIASWAGIEYRDLIKRIVDLALRRDR